MSSYLQPSTRMYAKDSLILVPGSLVRIHLQSRTEKWINEQVMKPMLIPTVLYIICVKQIHWILPRLFSYLPGYPGLLMVDMEELTWM